MTKQDKFNQIAREVLHLETLETRNMDRLDFHEHAVWSIAEALERAYEAGRQSVRPAVRLKQNDR